MERGQAETITVGVADDQPLMLRALAELVTSEPGFTLLGTATDGAEALALVEQQRPDVMLLDLDMPVIAGDDVIRRASAAGECTTRFLALTTFAALDWILAALRAGASGYLVKDAGPDEIIAAVRAVHEDTTVVSPRVAGLLAEHVGQSTLAWPCDANAPTLPPRSAEAVELLSRGLSNREIAARMCVSEAAVKQYLRRAASLLGARDRVQVLVRAVELGLVSPWLETHAGSGGNAAPGTAR